MSLGSSWQKISILMLIALLLTVPMGSFAQDDGDEGVCDAIVFLGGWSRPAVSLDGTGNGAGYGVLVNLGQEDDRLVGIQSEVASTVEIHEVTMMDDVMQMRPLVDGLPLPAGGFAQMQPGSFHIMYIGLTQDFVPDEEIAIELEFENAEPIAVSYTVTLDAPSGEDTILAISGDTSGCEDIGFYGGWATPTSEESDDSAVYGLFLNLSDEAVPVLGVSADVADMSDVMEMTIDDMDMDDDEDADDMDMGGLEVPANGFSLLSPDGSYIHLRGVADGLTAGDMFDLVVTFGDDTEHSVSVMVHMPSMGMDSIDGMDHDHDDDHDDGDHSDDDDHDGDDHNGDHDDD